MAYSHYLELVLTHWR